MGHESVPRVIKNSAYANFFFFGGGGGEVKEVYCGIVQVENFNTQIYNLFSQERSSRFLYVTVKL